MAGAEHGAGMPFRSAPRGPTRSGSPIGMSMAMTDGAADGRAERPARALRGPSAPLSRAGAPRSSRSAAIDAQDCRHGARAASSSSATLASGVTMLACSAAIGSSSLPTGARRREGRPASPSHAEAPHRRRHRRRDGRAAARRRDRPFRSAPAVDEKMRAASTRSAVTSSVSVSPPARSAESRRPLPAGRARAAAMTASRVVGEERRDS